MHGERLRCEIENLSYNAGFQFRRSGGYDNANSVNPVRRPAEIRQAMYWHERTHNEPSHQWFRQIISELAKSL